MWTKRSLRRYLVMMISSCKGLFQVASSLCDLNTKYVGISYNKSRNSAPHCHQRLWCWWKPIMVNIWKYLPYWISEQGTFKRYIGYIDQIYGVYDGETVNGVFSKLFLLISTNICYRLMYVIGISLQQLILWFYISIVGINTHKVF